MVLDSNLHNRDLDSKEIQEWRNYFKFIWRQE